MASYVSHNYGSGPSTAFLGLEETRGQETVSLTSDGKLPCKDPPGQMTEAFRISDISGRGRGLIAARNIQEGEEIMREMPLLVVPNEELADTFCGNCLCACAAGQGGAGVCPGCSRQVFCSEDCLRQAQSTAGAHDGTVCAGYKRLASIGGGSREDRDALRLLIHAQALRLAAARGDAAAATRYQSLMSLCGDGSRSLGRAPMELHAALSAVVGGRDVMPVEELCALLDKDAMNAYGFIAPVAPGAPSEERTLRGSCLYATASMVNHECTPNVARTENADVSGTEMRLTALRDIPAGEELQQSYVPLKWPLADRRAKLSEEYGFLCQCDRCQIEEGWTEGLTRLQSDMDWAVHIFTVKYTCGGCGGTMVPLGVCGSEGVQCNVCGVRRGKDDWQEDLQGQDGE